MQLYNSVAEFWRKQCTMLSARSSSSTVLRRWFPNFSSLSSHATVEVLQLQEQPQFSSSHTAEGQENRAATSFTLILCKWLFPSHQTRDNHPTVVVQDIFMYPTYCTSDFCRNPERKREEKEACEDCLILFRQWRRQQLK